MTEVLQSEFDASMMRRALSLARRAWGRTHPNPMVGAVITHRGNIIGEGNHTRAGEAHAEVIALQNARESGASLDGATLYVSLEPCSTHGRTPPCTDAILGSGIRRVVVGMCDPNPEHLGRGLDHLRRANVEVEIGILEDECEDLNFIFNHWIRNDRPLWAAKVATTLDGKIATRIGESQWISSSSSRQDVMRWRRLFPAIGVGSETLLRDDPRLTVRVDGETEEAPIRLVFDRRLRTFQACESLAVMSDAWRERTVVVTVRGHPESRLNAIRSRGCSVWEVDTKSWWDDINKCCFERGISGIYVEGGAGVLSSLMNERRLNYMFWYFAPKLMADDLAPSPFGGHETMHLKDCIKLERVRHAAFGDDVLVRGHVRYASVAEGNTTTIETPK